MTEHELTEKLFYTWEEYNTLDEMLGDSFRILDNGMSGKYIGWRWFSITTNEGVEIMQIYVK